MLDGWEKEDPPTKKKLLVDVDIPEFLADMARNENATEQMKVVGYLDLIGYYYLLWVGEYTKKEFRNESKQTKQFKVDDVTFFKKDAQGKLKQLPREAPSTEILEADAAMLKLDNQKNGWKGVYVNQANGELWNCGVRVLGCRSTHIRNHVKGTAGWRTYLSA